MIGLLQQQGMFPTSPLGPGELLALLSPPSPMQVPEQTYLGQVQVEQGPAAAAGLTRAPRMWREAALPECS